MAAIYSIDTSPLMDWHDRFFPVDIFVGLVSRMDALAAAGRLVSPALVKEESEKVGSQGLKQWTDGHSTVFVKTGDLLAPAQVIQGQFPGLLDPKAEFEEADAYVIALAQLRDGIVVTQETPAAEKALPNRGEVQPLNSPTRIPEETLSYGAVGRHCSGWRQPVRLTSITHFDRSGRAALGRRELLESNHLPGVASRIRSFVIEHASLPSRKLRSSGSANPAWSDSHCPRRRNRTRPRGPGRVPDGARASEGPRS